MAAPLEYMKIRRDDLKNTFGEQHGRTQGYHGGWDLYAKSGTPIMAVDDGEVVFVGTISGYGKSISLEFVNNGTVLYAFYAHLSDISVKKGQEVKEGEIIGKTGTTGNASNMKGPDQHLHFEILKSALPQKGNRGAKMDPGRVLGYETLSCKIN